MVKFGAALREKRGIVSLHWIGRATGSGMLQLRNRRPGAGASAAYGVRDLLWFPKIRSGRVGAVSQNQGITRSMLAIVHLLGTYLANLFKSRRRLEAENLQHRLEATTATTAAAGQ